MGIVKRYLDLSAKVDLFVVKKVKFAGEYLNLYRKRNQIKTVKLTKEQKKEIDAFYKEHYGKKIKHYWHRLYQSYTGIFKKDYFPEILLSTKLELAMNSIDAAEILGDKNMLAQLFGSVEEIHIPKTFISCNNGMIKNENLHLVNKEYISEVIKDKVCVIKKTIDTSSGRDVMICNFENGIDTKSNMTIDEIVKEMGNNFVIQEKIEQFGELSVLYPDSLNTFRVITYIINGEIYHCPLALRLARNGADRDNIHYGGIGVGVDDEGYLYEKAFEEFGGSYQIHPDTGVKFDGYRISKVTEMIECAKKLHACIPMLGIVSWDLTIDDTGKITIIEANTFNQAAWFPQIIQGKSLFGENTPYMLKLISNKK